MRKLRWFLIPPLAGVVLLVIFVALGSLLPNPPRWFGRLVGIQYYEPEPAETTSHVIAVATFTLSATDLQSDEWGVRLVAVAEDGTTEIQTVPGGVHLSAAPGHPFTSQEFGRQGLVLRDASAQTQTATFNRWTCETVTTSATK